MKITRVKVAEEDGPMFFSSLPEPRCHMNDPDCPASFELKITSDKRGVYVDHDDGSGATLYPWHRVIWAETRA